MSDALLKFFASLIPVIFLLSILFALVRKVRVYDSFTEGAKGAIPLITSLFPYVATVMMLTKALQTSGLEDKLIEWITPLFRFLHVPSEIAELVFVKPLSGSGATAMLADIIEKYGVDSYIGRCACVVAGSSETVFYIGAVYFAERKKPRLRAALVIALLSYLLSVVVSCLLCSIL